MTEARNGRSSLAHLLVAPLVWAAAILLVLPGWAISRILRRDPLDDQGTWRVRRRRRLAPWTRRLPRTVDRSTSPSTRRRTTALAVAAVVGVLAIAASRSSLLGLGGGDPATRGFVLDRDDPAVPVDLGEVEIDHPVPDGVEANEFGPGESSPAEAGEPWRLTDDYNQAQGAIFGYESAWRPVNPYRALDVTSRWINVHDGRRATWQAPPCECRRVRVWMYGGSTTFGLNQRDDHTIASELARVAWEHGLVVDVENRGEMGFLHWMEAERFALDLTVDPAPDLVIFYDGANDMWATHGLVGLDTGDIEPPIDPTLVDEWTALGRSEGPVPDGPPGAKVLGLPPGDLTDQRDWGQVAAARYDRSRQLSQASADHHGIEVRYIWQPTRVSRPLVPEEPHANTDNENWIRLGEQVVRASLPEDVIDLADVFDGNTEPLFTDDVHHNEAGARIVAAALYDELEDDLRALSGRGGR